MQNDKTGSLLNKAKELEKRYDWLGAAKFYEKASDLVSKDFLKAAELFERIGFCYFRAALQAETNKQFRNRMKLAVQAYERMVELVEKAEEEGKEAKINHVFFIDELILPEGEKDYAKMREMAKRKGRIVRKAVIDGVQKENELGFEA